MICENFEITLEKRTILTENFEITLERKKKTILNLTGKLHTDSPDTVLKCVF